MHQAHLARSLLLDASPFRRFTDTGLLAEFVSYLPKATVVAEVGAELDDAARSRRNAALAQAIERMKWPKRIAGLAGAQQLSEATTLLQILRAKDPAKDHTGEVATILRAKELAVQLVVMDDREARLRVARPRDVNTIPTAMVVAEMTQRGALTEEQGWNVFQACALGVTFADFERAVARAAEPPAEF